jgi:hypothetical protein
MPSIEDAIALAALAHKGQKDKAGHPYILHPLRMMLGLETEAERMAAVLHDVVEDTPHTLESLRALGYPENVIEAVEGLTKKPGENYDDFILRAGKLPLARRVKLADLKDNLDLGRIPNPTPKDEERLLKYGKARAVLMSLEEE